MASSGKRKTTGAKLAREGKLRERRAAKAAKKDARRSSPGEHTAGSDFLYGPPNPSGLPELEPETETEAGEDAGDVTTVADAVVADA
jgi:hypothetical protein